MVIQSQGYRNERIFVESYANSMQLALYISGDRKMDSYIRTRKVVSVCMCVCVYEVRGVCGVRGQFLSTTRDEPCLEARRERDLLFVL